MAVKPQSPIQAIHSFCKQCQMSRQTAVLEACNHRNCPVWTYRLGVAPSGKTRGLLGVIKEYCRRECQGIVNPNAKLDEVRDCCGNAPTHSEIEPCPLFPFRLGKHPTKAGNGKSFKKRV